MRYAHIDHGARIMAATRARLHAGRESGSSEEVIVMTTDLGVVEALFATAPVSCVPTLADRYAYKKEPGSSDARNTEDVIKT